MSFLRRKKRKTRGGRSQHPRSVLIKQIVLGMLLCVFVGGVGVGIWHGSRVDALTITEVDISGGETIDHDTVRALVEEELTGSYYHLVPRRFAWTYPQERISERVQELERIDTVSLTRESGTTLRVEFTEYHPFALWCGSEVDGECLFMDATGYAFARAPQLSGGAFVRFIKYDTEEPAVGTTPFDSNFVRESTAFIERAYEELGLTITIVEQINEDDVIYSIAGGGTLKLSLRMPLADAYENLHTLLQSPEFAHIAPGTFQYIDLRYGNKVFVNEEPPQLDSTATSSAQSVEE